MFAQADRYRSFITDPNPVWAPQTYGSATVKRSHGRLTCSPPVYTERVDKLAYTWLDSNREVGSGRTFKTSSRHRAGDLPDRGEQRRRILDCAFGTVLVRDRAQGEGARLCRGFAVS